jgi:ABC-2 type transport system permease protein
VRRAARYWRIYVACVRNCLLRELEFRAHFLFSLVATLGWAALSVVLATLVFSNVRDVAGWDLDRMYVLTGTFILVVYGRNLLFERSMHRLSELVNKGELDFVLTKPISSQFLVSVRYVDFTELAGVIAGIGLVLFGIGRVNLRPSPVDVGLYLLLVACAILSLYALWFMTVSFTIWTGRINNAAHLVPAIFSMARMPTDIFRGLVNLLLTFALPLALASTLPAEALLGTLEPWMAPYQVALTAALLWASHRFWNASLRRYSSASS